MHVEEGALQRVMEQLTKRDLTALDTRRACELVVSEMPALFGADGAGLLLVDDTQVLRYVASSDSGAHLLEAAQESSGRGPCVQSLVEGLPVAVSDFETDTRWPDLGEVLATNGVRSVFGLPVNVHGVAIGSLNIYASVPREWDESDKAALQTVDVLVERILSTALAFEQKDELVGQLQRALEARVTVERAVGVLMAVEFIDAPAAFERIRGAARSARRPVREIAAGVIAARGLS